MAIVIVWRSTASFCSGTYIEIWHYIENPECLHRDVFPLQRHSPNTRVWHLYFTCFLWIRKKVCSMLSAGPKYWQTLWQHLYQRVISTENLSLCLTLVPSPRFNSVGQFILHTCASLFLHFSLQYLVQIFLIFFLLKTTSSVFPWLTQGLSIWRTIKQNHPSSFSKWIIQSPWNLSEEALVQDCTCLSLSSLYSFWSLIKPSLHLHLQSNWICSPHGFLCL